MSKGFPVSEKIMLKRYSFQFLLICSLFIYLLDYFKLFTSLKKNTNIYIISLKQTVFATYQSLKNTSEIIRNFQQISKEYEELKLQKVKDTSLNFELSLLRQENENLRKQLQAPLPPSYVYLPAKVIGITRFMEIDLGEDLGVKIDLPVVFENILIGKIIEVSSRRSLVRLVTDNESKISVKTARGAKGEASGLFQDSLQLGKVLQKDPLFLDDMVMTTGEDGFPPNLLIGKVFHIFSEDIKVYKQAKFKTLLDFASLKNVFIIKNQ